MANKKEIKKGKIYVSATFNNTLVNVCDEIGNTLCWSSSGNTGFKGTRKATPFAATSAVEKALKSARENYDLIEADIYIKGPGPGRDAALRAIRAAGIRIASIADVTPFPHNGPRAKKKRRA